MLKSYFLHAQCLTKCRNYQYYYLITKPPIRYIEHIEQVQRHFTKQLFVGL